MPRSGEEQGSTIRGQRVRRRSRYHRWPEVQYINSYAAFMVYLQRAVAALGILIFTWSTVVLLGGFVSKLAALDFWFLTVITFSQTKEASDAIMGGLKALRPTRSSAVLAIALITTEPPQCLHNVSQPLFYAAHVTLVVFRLIVSGTVYLPFMICYVFGVYISAVISVVRLTRRDVHRYAAAAATNDDDANLKPALRIIYVLAVVQGMLSLYLLTFLPYKRKVVSRVVKEYKIVGRHERHAVGVYTRETVSGCLKDASFAEGRNLVTYAVHLLESSSLGTDSLLHGLSILAMLIPPQVDDSDSSSASATDHGVVHPQDDSSLSETESCGDMLGLEGQHALMRQLLLGSTSSAHIFGKLLRTICLPASESEHAHAAAAAADDDDDPRAELRKNALTIVAHFAGDICLNKLPDGEIECLSSMLELSAATPKLDSHKDDILLEDLPVLMSLAADKDMVLQGLRILWSLAADKDNCRIITNHDGLLSRIMAPVSSNLHRLDDDMWSDVVRASMELVGRLLVVAAHGVVGDKLRREIIGDKDAVAAMEEILSCDYCNRKLQIVAVEILTKLAMDTSSTISTIGRENLAKNLVRILADGDKHSSVRKSAGQALAMLLSAESNIVVVVLQAGGDFVGLLKHMLLQAEEDEIRISAAEILEHLYRHGHRHHFNNDGDNDEHRKELKKTIKNVVPEVLREVLQYGATGRQTQMGEAAAADTARYSPPGTADIEGLQDCNSRSNGEQNYQQHVVTNRKLLAAFLSLTFETFEDSQAQDLVQLVGAVAPGDAAFTFAGKLREMIERNSEPTADCLRIMKLTHWIVTTMLRHGANEVEDLRNLMNYLGDVSLTMYNQWPRRRGAAGAMAPPNV